ncbi:FAD-binding oxidoreductase [Actinorugispora endophytica]|uniref:Decaprenylphospho-beta-D-ribofuranose 2-oxidase n=1 Tax=Actinorugispora endophytica TaxID=1605990 RepID=A0A4R6UX50_9ACTN|nr:FAD-binding oxidoreductase [Actinorugispora endophytica]TDQ52008.1 decaprenylphospho-beta-D-ribofuranose 2-oxidase [Actinorugispora endophytica]
MRRRSELLTGWGRTGPSRATVARPRTADELALLLREAARPGGHGLIARGLGRSYGDAAQCAGGLVADCAELEPGHRLDTASGTVTASAGTSLDRLTRYLVPRGYFVPVTPGTRHVTVGGAVGADIHGKNHHVDSSFGAHVRSLTLVTPDGTAHRIGPDRDAELFWATVGGMGLTGVVTEAAFAVLPIETSRMRVDTDRTPDLDAALALMDESDDRYRYTVCWIDLLARGRALGRGVLTRAHHATRDELPPAARRAPLRFAPGAVAGVPRHVPPRLLNPLTVRAFNAAYHARAPRVRRDEIQDMAGFFHPLDALRDWNRVYGPRGLVQYQFMVPFGEEGTLRRIAERLAERRAASFLAVLKRFGRGTPAPLSFPGPGWTLALDLPAGLPGLAALLTGLDELVLDAGGRIYLAKDSRAAAPAVHAMYPGLERWRRVRDRVDPDRVLVSDLSRRLGL